MGYCRVGYIVDYTVGYIVGCRVDCIVDYMAGCSPGCCMVGYIPLRRTDSPCRDL